PTPRSSRVDPHHPLRADVRLRAPGGSVTLRCPMRCERKFRRSNTSTGSLETTRLQTHSVPHRMHPEATPEPRTEDAAQLDRGHASNLTLQEVPLRCGQPISSIS